MGWMVEWIEVRQIMRYMEVMEVTGSLCSRRYYSALEAVRRRAVTYETFPAMLEALEGLRRAALAREEMEEQQPELRKPASAAS